MYTNQRLVSVAKLLGFIIVLALVAYGVYVFLHTGKLVVTTDKANAITVSRMNGKPVTQKFGVLSIKLRDGQYTLSVHGKVLSTNQTITIHGRQVVTKTIRTKPALVIQPVKSGAAQNVRANGSSLSFLNPDDGAVYSIDQSNAITTVSGAGLYRSISWLDGSTAILQSQEGYMYVLANGQITSLPADISALRGVVNSYGVSPDRSIYLGVGNDVYVGDESGHFKKIYTAKSTVSGLYPSNDSVAVLTTKIGGTKQPETTATVSLVRQNGLFVADDSFPLNDEFAANFSVVWSPNGQRLAIANSESLGVIFDTSFKKVSELPSTGVTGVGWKNNTSLYYSTSNLLWGYDAVTGSASVVANAATGNAINNIVVDDTGAYVYFTVLSGESTSLSRIGLLGQVLTDSAYQLAAFFPADLGSCSVDYINFTSPVLLVKYGGDLADCQTQLNTTLNQDGLSLDGIQVQYVPQT